MGKKQPPIGFGRTPMPEEAGQEPNDDQPKKPKKREVPPPLVQPLAVDDVEMYEILERYGIQLLLPPAKLEYQLVEIIAALEKRVRELDPDL